MSTEDEKRFKAFKTRFDSRKVSSVSVHSLDLVVVNCPQAHCSRKLSFAVYPEGRIVEVDVLFDRGTGFFGIPPGEPILSRRIRDYLKSRGIVCCPECKTMFKPAIRKMEKKEERLRIPLKPPPLPEKK